METHLHRFKQFIEANNLRIADIANATGISHSSVSSYVNSDPDNPQKIQIGFIQAIAAKLPIDLNWWLLGEGQAPVFESVSFPENMLREPDQKPSYGSTGGKIMERLDDLQILSEIILKNVQNMQSPKKSKPSQKC